MKTTNTKLIIFATLCVASFATADVAEAIFAKAKEAEDDGSVNFCGFYVGMSKADAETLASHYGLKYGEFLIEGNPVYSVNFSLKGVRRITKGGNSYDELCQAVANRVGRMTSKSTDSIWDEGWLYEYDTIDGIRVTMSENGHSGGGIKAGFSMFDENAKRAAERNAREAERNAWEAERKAREAGHKTREEARQVALDWKTESKLIPISSSIAIDLQSVPGPLWFGKTEVTQTQWEAVMGSNPSEFKNPDNPVEHVSWEDCQEFLKKLNAIPSVNKSGLVFRLPTEEEWELACRAGSMGIYCRLADGTEVTRDRLDQVAWYVGNSSRQPHPVGQKRPNAFGLYDMHGNVWEWTSTADRNNRVSRGGCFDYTADYCAADSRYRINPVNRNGRLGLRLAASGRVD